MTEDAEAMVEAVLDVLAPEIDGPPGFGGVRWPRIRYDHEGTMVVPDDEQLRGLATQIVTAIRTATTPDRWVPCGDGEQRPVRGGLTAVIAPSGRNEDHWTWTIEERYPGGSRAIKGVGYATSPEGARAKVAGWEAAHSEGTGT